MSEENNENLQQILNLQIQIAAGMKLSDEVVDFLRGISDWGKREWYYLCAIDRMPLSKLMEMNKKNYSVPKIRKERQDYLVSMYSDLDSVNQQVEKLKKEAQEVFAESRDLKEAIMANLETALNKQASAQEETIRTKDSMIDMLRDQIKRLEAELQDKGNAQHRSVEYDMPARSDNGSVVQTEVPTGNGILAESRRIWMVKKKQGEIRRFINIYIKNVDFSDEQKDFLLTCLEEGMAPSEVAEFASPNLSLDVMQRLKKFRIEKNKTKVKEK